MLPVHHQTQNNITTKKNHTAASATQESSDEQLQTMATPKRVNALQWELSNPQERRELLKHDSGLKQAEAKPSKQGSKVTTRLEQMGRSQPHGSFNNLPHVKRPSSRSINQGILEQMAGAQLHKLHELLSNSQAISSQLKSAGVLEKVISTSTQNATRVPQQNNTEQTTLETITRNFQQRFVSTAQNKTEFHNLMQKSFGSQYDSGKAETLRQQALKGDFCWMPKIQLVNGSQLQDISQTQSNGTAQGAYSQSKDTVYLSREMLINNPAMAEKILTEEVGHAIDAKINIKDAKGDEGDIFSRLSHGEEINSTELAELQQENDSGTIEINGNKIEVEYGFFNRFKKIRKKSIATQELLSSWMNGTNKDLLAFQEKATSLLAEGEYGAVAHEIEKLLLQHSHVIKLTGQTDNYKRLTNVLNQMDKLDSQIKAGAWEDMGKTLKTLDKFMNAGLKRVGMDPARASLADTDFSLSGIVDDLNARLNPIVSAYSNVIDDLFIEGHYEAAADIVENMAKAMGRDSNPKIYDLLIAKAESMRPDAHVYTYLPTSRAAMIQMGELMAVPSAFEENKLKLVEIINGMSDEEYISFIKDFKHSRYLSALQYDKRFNTRTFKAGEIIDLLAERGATIVQSDSWYADNMGILLSNHKGQKLTYEQIEGLGMLARTPGGPGTAKYIFAEFHGLKGPYTKTFTAYMTMHVRILNNQWSTTEGNPEERRALVQTWAEQGSAQAIGKILGVNLAAYMPAEGKMAEGTLKTNMEVAQAELSEVMDILQPLGNKIEERLDSVRAKMMASHTDIWEKTYVKTREGTLIAKYSAMTDEQLDTALGSFKKGTPYSLNIESWEFEPVIAFKEKFKRLQQKYNNLGASTSTLNGKIEAGGTLPSVSEMADLRHEIVKLNEQVFNSDALFDDHLTGLAGEEELKTGSEKVKQDTQNLKVAMEQAKKALGDELGPDWVTKENAQLLAAALKAKQSLRDFRQMLSDQTDVEIPQEVLLGLDNSIAGIQQVIDAQRMAAATTKWMDKFSADSAVEMLGKVGGFDFTGMDKPIPLQEAQAALSSSIMDLKVILASTDSSLADKTDAVTIVRSKAIALKKELQEFRDMLPADGVHAGVIDDFLSSIDGLIEQLKPADQTVTADNVRLAVAKKLKGLADANPQALKALLSKVFNINDQAKLDVVIENIKSGSIEWMPEVIIADNATMQGNFGAYSAEKDVIYLNAAVLKIPQQAFQVFLEELGHSIDVDLNGEIDTQGDEGELFRRLLSGEKLTATQIHKIRNTDDHTRIIIDGVEVTVELFRIKFVENFFKKAGEVIEDVVDSIVEVVADIADFVIEFVGDYLEALGDFAEAIGEGLVKLVASDAFQILSLGLQVFFPGSYPALMAMYAAAGASIYMGVKTGDMRLVLQGLAQAALGTADFGGDLFGLSQTTTTLFKEIGTGLNFALKLDNAIRNKDVIGFLIDEINALPETSKFADLKKFVKPLELTVAYQKADSDVGRAAAVLGFVGYVAEGTETGDIATELSQKTDLVIKIDKAIKDKDWAAAQGLVMGFLKNDTNLSEERLATVGNVLYIGASVAEGVEAIESKEWSEVVNSLGNIALGVSKLADPEDLQAQADLIEGFEQATKIVEGIDVLSQVAKGDLDISEAAGSLVKLYADDFPGLSEAISKIKGGIDLANLIANLDGDVESVVGAMLVIVAALGKETGVFTEKQLNTVQEIGKKLLESWKSGDYKTAAEEFKKLGQALTDGTDFAQYQQKINDFADNWIEPFGYAKDLWNAVKDNDIDAILDSSLKIASLTGSSERVKEIQKAAESLNSNWNAGNYEEAATALKQLGHALTDRTAFAKYQPLIDKFVDNWVEPLGYSRDLKKAIEKDKVDINEVKTIVGKLATIVSDNDDRTTDIISSADKLAKAWDAGQYVKAADEFKTLAGLLVKGTGLASVSYTTKIADFADKWIIRFGYIRDLKSAIESKDIDKVLSTISQLATLGGYGERVDNIREKAAEFEIAWKAGQYQKAQDVFTEMVPLLTEGSGLESYNQEIIDFIIDKLVPIGFAVKLGEMIRDGKIEEAKAMVKAASTGKKLEFVSDIITKVDKLDEHWNAGEYAEAANVFKDISKDLMPEEAYKTHGKKIEELADKWIVRFGYTRDLQNAIEKDNVDIDEVKTIVGKIASHGGDTNGRIAAIMNSADRLVEAWEDGKYSEASNEFKILADLLVEGTGLASESYKNKIAAFADKWIVRFGYTRDLHKAIEAKDIDSVIAAVISNPELKTIGESLDDVKKAADKLSTSWNGGDYEDATRYFKELTDLLTVGTTFEKYQNEINIFADNWIIPFGYTRDLKNAIKDEDFLKVIDIIIQFRNINYYNDESPEIAASAGKIIELWNKREYEATVEEFKNFDSLMTEELIGKGFGNTLLANFAEKWILMIGSARDLKKAIENNDNDGAIAAINRMPGMKGNEEIVGRIKEKATEFMQLWSSGKYTDATVAFKKLTSMLKVVTGLELDDVSQLLRSSAVSQPGDVTSNIETDKVVASDEISGVKESLPPEGKRGLTEDEINLARSVFGDSIDYQSVKIHHESFFPFGLQDDNVAMAPDGNIYFDPDGDLYESDFSTADINSRALFIHEMVHIWQHQQGVNVMLKGIVERDYNYSLTDGKSFSQYGIEQQGNIVRDYFYMLSGISKPEWSPMDVYKNLIPFSPETID